MGMLYKRGEVYWIKYYISGKPIRESTGTSKQKEAERFLKDRDGRVAMGAPDLPRLDRLRFGEAAEALTEHYRVTGSRQLKDVQRKLKPVRGFFNHHRLVGIDHASITTYMSQRQALGLSNATINRESLLGKTLRLAQERGQLVRIPRIHLLQESAPRSGFFERGDFERVRKHLTNRPDLQVAISLAHAFGWRMQSEVLQMNLSQVDLAAGTLRLEPGTTKNREGRTVYLTPELLPLLSEQIERVKALSRKLNRVVPVFIPEPSKGTVSGGPASRFQKGLADRLSESRNDRDAPARFQTQRREKFSAIWSRGDSGDEDQRAQRLGASSIATTLPPMPTFGMRPESSTGTIRAQLPQSPLPILT